MAEAVYFDAVLHPSRSMTRRGLVILICLVITANMSLALRALSAGGWPILPFLGLDVAALAGARARVLHGPINGRAALNGIVHSVLELPRDPAKLRGDEREQALVMWKRKGKRAFENEAETRLQP